MRSKPTTLICAALAAACALAATAVAAPIPVAFYTFETQADADAFSKGFGAKCKKKLVPGAKAEAPADDEGKKKPPATTGQMGITVGPGTNHCAFRSSVVGDSADVAPDTEVVGTGTVGRNTPEALQKKAFVGIGVRNSEQAGWELRVLPGAQTWQLLRDPAGTSAGATIARAGKGKFIKTIGKPNALVLRTFDFGSSDTQLIATVNGKSVVTLTDSADDQPDGRRNLVVAGAKGTAAGTGITGLFDDVAIRVPNPYE
jgi:hypothetical protein